MNVRPAPNPSSPPVAKADAAGERTTAPPSSSAPAPAPSDVEGDRVELSAAGLARSSAGRSGGAGSDLEVARTALRSGADLGAAELHELREKVRTGHYDRPDVLDRVAGAAARDLAP